VAICTEDNDGVRRIVLAGVVDIAQAAELKEALMETATSESRVSIQVSGATSIDVTTAQLLWAAVSCPFLLGPARFVVDGPWSPEVEQSFLNSGLAPILSAMLQRPSPQERTDVLASRY
jgi:anti-anti-sigma regulatory factor